MLAVSWTTTCDPPGSPFILPRPPPSTPPRATKGNGNRGEIHRGRSSLVGKQNENEVEDIQSFPHISPKRGPWEWGGQKRIWIWSCHLWIQKSCYFWGNVPSNFFLTFKKSASLSFFFFGPAACGILVPQPGIEVVPPAMGAQDLNHWTARKVLKCPFFTQCLPLGPPPHWACSTPGPISLPTQWARIKQVT